MSNPLKSMLGGMNPMNIIQGMMGSNPQEMLINMLKQKNPQGFEQLKQMQESGQDPNKILEGMMSKMTPEQKAQIQQFGSQFGIR